MHAYAEDRVSSPFYSVARPAIMQNLQTCKDYKIAGNQKLYLYCITSKLNSLEYIDRQIQSAKVNKQITNVICLEHMIQNFEYGARCIAAATEICKQDSSGEFIDKQSCYRVMGNFNWMANPSAQSLDFSKPARKEDDIKQYVD